MTTGRYPEPGEPQTPPGAHQQGAYGRGEYDEPQTRAGAYRQGTYGRNEYGEPVNPFGAAADDRFGIAGIATGLIGAIAVLVALTGLDWFSGPTTGRPSASATCTTSPRPARSATSARSYFGWLAWVFFIVAVVAVILAAFPSPALRAFRAIGVVVGVAAAGLAFLAIKPSGGAGYGHILGDSSVGFWLAVAGFLLAAIGAGIGAQRA